MDHEERGIALVMNKQKFDPPLAPQKPVKERVWSKKMDFLSYIKYYKH